jgi:hypothetical protein
MIGACRLVKEVASCDRVTYAHSSAVVAWTPIFTKNFGVLIPMVSVDADVSVAYYRAGIFNYAIADGVTVAQGDHLYYTVSTGKVTTTAPSTVTPTTAFYLGRASAAGSATAGYVNVEVGLVPNTFIINQSVTAAVEAGRIWISTEATSGILRGLSTRIFFTAAGSATGDAGRFYACTDVSIANMHGIHSTAQLGAEDAASVGTVTGQAAGVRATIGIGLTNTAPAGGTLAAIRADSHFLSSAAGAVSSFLYFTDVNTSYGVDAILRCGAIVDRSTDAGSGGSGLKAYTYDAMTLANITSAQIAFRVVTQDGTFYMLGWPAASISAT